MAEIEPQDDGASELQEGARGSPDPATTDGNPITFTDLGITDLSPTRDTVIGKVRRFQDLRKKEIAFLVLTGFCLLVLFVITIERLVVVEKQDADFTFGLLLILNAVFCLYYLVSGIFMERPYELFILVIATAVVWLYMVLNYAISSQGIYKMIRLIAASVCCPPIIVLGGLITHNYRDSKHVIFRTVGAHTALQEMCATVFTFFSFLKADLQLSLSMTILVMQDGSQLSLEDKIVLPLLITISIASFVIAYLSVRLEKRKLAYLYGLIWVLVPAYTVYVIIHASKTMQRRDLRNSELGIIWVTFVCAALSLTMRVILLFYGFKAFIDFGKGLRDHIYRQPEARREGVGRRTNIQ